MTICMAAKTSNVIRQPNAFISTAVRGQNTLEASPVTSIIRPITRRVRSPINCEMVTLPVLASDIAWPSPITNQLAR